MFKEKEAKTFLPMNIQSWFPLESIGLISLQSRGFSRIFSSITMQRHTLPSILYRMKWMVSSEPGDQVTWEILALIVSKTGLEVHVYKSFHVLQTHCTWHSGVKERANMSFKYVPRSCQLMATWDLEIWAELPWHPIEHLGGKSMPTPWFLCISRSFLLMGTPESECLSPQPSLFFNLIFLFHSFCSGFIQL